MGERKAGSIMNTLTHYELSPGLIIDYPPFDDLHRDLLDRLSELDAQSEGGDVNLEALHAFVTAFIEHMTIEVSILERLGYPVLDEHARHHQELRDKALSLLNDHKAAPIDGDTVKELLWYLFEDALKDDLKAKEFLSQQPIIAA